MYKRQEDFWVKAEKLYYTALIVYIWYEAPDHEKNFTTLLEMINASEAREDDETFKNPVDVMFDELEARDPDHFAVKQYRKYKLAAGKTAKSILISCGARLAPFDIAELRELMSYDEMELDTIGAVSYTHLDVYKRQSGTRIISNAADLLSGQVFPRMALPWRNVCAEFYACLLYTSRCV